MDLLESDRRHVWHPYGPMPGRPDAAGGGVGGGVRLRLAGRRPGELVDGMSSWWAAIHGYRHPVLDAAAADQLGRMSHVMFGGLTHEPAVRLAERLVEMAPDGLEHVFLCRLRLGRRSRSRSRCACSTGARPGGRPSGGC